MRRTSGLFLPQLLLSSFLFLASSKEHNWLGGDGGGGANNDRRLVELAGYRTETTVTDFAAMALDQAKFVELLYAATDPNISAAVAEVEYKYATRVYEKGGFSDSYAELMLLEPLPWDTDMGANVTGKTGSAPSSAHVTGTLMKNHPAGYKGKIKVLYPVQDDLVEYMQCQVGGRPDPFYHGCFTGAGSITFEGHEDIPIKYQYYPSEGNINGRTLHSMAAAEGNKFRACGSCGYFPEFQKLVDYYDDPLAPNHMVMAAVEGTATNFAHKAERTNMDFSAATPVARAAAADALTAYMVISGNHMVREIEMALVKCGRIDRDCSDEDPSCREAALRNIDAAAALYAGSMVNSKADEKHGAGGNLLYGLAQQECSHFRTCVTSNRKNDQAAAAVNENILMAFGQIQDALLKKMCVDARRQKDRVVRMHFVPLVQALLRAAYNMDASYRSNIIHEDGSEDDPAICYQKQQGRGAALAAMLLPHISACRFSDADLLYKHMHMQPTSNHTSFDEVKALLERNYACIGVTCSQVGGLWNGKNYYPGASPCQDEKSDEEQPKKKTQHVKSIMIIIVVVAILLFLYRYKRKKEKLQENNRRNRKHFRDRDGWRDDDSLSSDGSDLSSLGDDDEEYRFT